MSYLGVTSLQNYDSWVGRSPAEIKRAVAALPHGWLTVFGSVVPRWANRVRNYFNETPKQLTLLDVIKGADLVHDLPRPGLYAKGALPDLPAVYRDSRGKHWFMMVPGGAVYHMGNGKPTGKDIAKAQYRWQSHSVFKLVSPDSTGGSSEVILKNPRKQMLVGRTGQTMPIAGDVVFDNVLRGSYNFAETLVRGFTRHEHYDVKPHERMVAPYLNPPAFTSLEARVFPPLPR
ncbi:MAG: hypothetical protein AAF726_01460 [Planctomycetota bacterium]